MGKFIFVACICMAAGAIPLIATSFLVGNYFVTASGVMNFLTMLILVWSMWATDFYR